VESDLNIGLLIILMHVIIAGGGRLGEALANLLVNEKHDVVLIEKDEKLSEELAERLDALVLHGDASESKILKDANIEKSDAVVAMTGDDKTNLMICEVAKSFKVSSIVSRINRVTNEGIFVKLGITASINTTTSAVLAFKKVLEKPGKRLVNLIAGEKAEVFEMLVSEGSGAIDKKIKELEKNFIIAAIYRNGELMLRKPDKRVQEDDILIICAPLEEGKKIEGLF